MDRDDLAPDGESGKFSQARRLVEAARRAERAGDGAEADRLMAQATRTDPDAVVAILQEAVVDRAGSEAAPAPDAEVAAISEATEPGADPPPRAGIIGSGSGADAERR